MARRPQRVNRQRPDAGVLEEGVAGRGLVASRRVRGAAGGDPSGHDLQVTPQPRPANASSTFTNRPQQLLGSQARKSPDTPRRFIVLPAVIVVWLADAAWRVTDVLDTSPCRRTPRHSGASKWSTQRPSSVTHSLRRAGHQHAPHSGPGS